MLPVSDDGWGSCLEARSAQTFAPRDDRPSAVSGIAPDPRGGHLMSMTFDGVIDIGDHKLLGDGLSTAFVHLEGDAVEARGSLTGFGYTALSAHGVGADGSILVGGNVSTSSSLAVLEADADQRWRISATNIVDYPWGPPVLLPDGSAIGLLNYRQDLRLPWGVTVPFPADSLIAWALLRVDADGTVVWSRPQGGTEYFWATTTRPATTSSWLGSPMVTCRPWCSARARREP